MKLFLLYPSAFFDSALLGTGKISVNGTVDTSCPTLGVAWVTPNPGFPIKFYLWFWNVVSDAYSDINIILCCALPRTLPGWE